MSVLPSVLRESECPQLSSVKMGTGFTAKALQRLFWKCRIFINIFFVVGVEFCFASFVGAGDIDFGCGFKVSWCNYLCFVHFVFLVCARVAGCFFSLHVCFASKGNLVLFYIF